MNSKKISFENVKYICNWKKPHRALHYLCHHRLVKECNNGYRVESKYYWPIYLLLFIPFHIIQFFYDMWNEGIKNFTITPNKWEGYYVSGITNDKEDTMFGRAIKVWNDD